ncbi:LysR family transcriptional regulator [Streptomyces sp. NPDC020965]|uniref:LysR family transcriptional regulator n=1 Tax=Streptomyces sp. NPDC020965 TaxID=3365105 RepID=UPI0037968709
MVHRGGYRLRAGGCVNVELRHAKIVAVIDRVGSISKAAVELKLPQSSLTAQLRRIEKAVGGDLFIRSRSGVVATSLGERLIPMLVELVQQADMVIAEAAAFSSDVFRFGHAEWTPPSLRSALQDALPVGEVQTETLNPAAAVEAVRRGVLNAAMVPSMALIAPAEVPELALARTIIVREPVWLAVPWGHPLSGYETVDTADLADLTWVRFTRDHWFHPIERHVFAKLDGRADPDVLHYVDGHHEAMSWVRDAGAAALTTPTGATRDICLVPITGTESTEILLVRRGDALSRDTLRSLVKTIRLYYCEYARTIPRYWCWIIEHPENFTELRRFLPTAVA